MSIVRTSHNRENPYVMLNKSALEDSVISWNAKGLWAYLMSRPDNWKVSVSHLCTIYSEKGGGEKAIYSMLNELILTGYCLRSQQINEKGQFQSYDYTILEFKNLLPHLPQADAAEGDAVQGPPTNKGFIINKEKEQQQEASPPKQIAAVFSCLEQEDIPVHEKIWLTKTYDEEIVQHAIIWIHHPKIKITETFIQALKWACKNKPDLPKSPEDLEQENKQYAQEIRVNTTHNHNAYFEVLHKSVEIGYTAAQSIPFVMEYTCNEFKTILIGTLKKYGFITKETNKKAQDESNATNRLKP